MTPQHSLRILILDDHELTAYGIETRLKNLLPDAVFDVLSTGSDACQLLKSKKHHLYIIDLELKDMSGIDIIKCIRAKYKNANILVCTLHEEMWYIKELKELKVNGILFKSLCLDMLDKTVTELLAGRTFYCDRFNMLTNNHRELENRFLLYEKFTDNELEVLHLICKGFNTKEIAEEKCWSIKAVEYYRKRLFEKFSVSNSSALVARAIKEGFIKKDSI
jgi:DNA-binding NarL/FixJ family response regulator